MDTIATDSNNLKTANTKALLKEIIAEIAPVNVLPTQIRDDANLYEECGIDSIAAVELFLAIESKFSLNFTEAELDTNLFKNLSMLTRFVESKRSI